MQITRELLAGKILEYLNRRIAAEDLAVWAEDAMIESDYQEEYFTEIAEGLAKIGVMNVKSFELPVAFFLNLLIKLDYLTIFGLEPAIEKGKELIYA
ncbi:MAG: hypothetical protein SFU99_05080 [Saprospiraceae bacterium]|nr:hypothetical protein [Saprospiraceae bacterium]